MAALTADRNTKWREGVNFQFPVAAATKIFAGSLVGINASNVAVPMTASTALKSVGLAQELADNSAGAASAINVKVTRGLALLANGETIVLSDIGATAYANDDQTVYTTATGRSAIGIIRDVTSEGVWVEFT